MPEYVHEMMVPEFFRKLFDPSEVKEVRFSACKYADLRKFGRDALYLVTDAEILRTGLQASLDGILIYTVKGQPEHHIIATMRDGAIRTFCQEHHVFLAGSGCRYCDGEGAIPVTEFKVPERRVLSPVTDVDIDKQHLMPLSVYCGVSEGLQKKFDTLARDHQKTCNRRHFGVENRWVITFEPTDAWIEMWVKVTVKCKLCGLETVLLDECDLGGPYAQYKIPVGGLTR